MRKPGKTIERPGAPSKDGRNAPRPPGQGRSAPWPGLENVPQFRTLRTLVARHPWALHLFAVAITGLTLIVRSQLDVAFHDRPLLILFMLPIILSAAMGGLWTGLLSTGIAGAGAYLFFIPRDAASWRVSSHDLVQWSMLLASGALVSLLCEMLHRFLKLHQAEKETLREQEALLRLFVDYAPAALAMLDTDMRYLAVSRRWLQDFGLPGQSVLGRSHYEIFPEIPERWKDIHRRCLAGAVEQADEDPFERADGGIQWIKWEIRPWHEASGAVGGIVIFSEDITERKRMQEVMIQTEKMMSVGGVAAGMAHEINNPLGIIIQSVQVVAMRLSPDAPANKKAAEACGCDLACIRSYLEQRRVFEFLEAIREAGTRAAKIVANMLEFSRKSENVSSLASMNALLDKSLELAGSDYDLKKNYDFRRVAITRDYQPDLPPLTCVEVQLEQVFMNILRNAAQALAEQRQADSPPGIVLRTRLEGDHVRIEIEDNGPGMDEATREHIFKPFFTTKPPGVGTGLGLSVSAFIIATNHGGSIAVEPAPGRGTRFVIRLPLAGPQ